MKIQILFPISILLLTSVSCGDKKISEKKDSDSYIPVKLIQVEEKAFERPISTYGVLATNEEINLSFKTPGIIRKMYVKEGESIRKGQLLAELDFAEINAHETQLTESYEKSLRDFRRAQNLYADSVITLEQLQNAETELNIQKQSLDVMTFNKAHAQIKAPANGIVLRKTANNNEHINPGIPVYQVSTENEGLIIKTPVTVHDWVNISEGDTAKIELEAFPDRKLTGIVQHIAGHADPNSGLYMLTIKILSQEEKINVGMFAKVHIQTRKQPTYKTIPVECISEGTGNDAHVYIAEGKQVKKVPIKIALVHNGIVFTSHGLENINKVINEGVGFLSENTLISIQE